MSADTEAKVKEALDAVLAVVRSVAVDDLLCDLVALHAMKKLIEYDMQHRDGKVIFTEERMQELSATAYQYGQAFINARSP